MIPHRATLDVSRELAQYLGRLLWQERRLRGTPKGGRALTCFRQAIMVLRWFPCTSGGWIGQVFALVSGVLVARWSAERARRIGLAVAAGLGLGLTDLLAAWSRAAPELHRTAGPGPLPTAA